MFQSEELQLQGVELLKTGDHAGAVQLFSEAIEWDPESAQLFLHRSNAFCRLEKYEEALSDAEQAVELKPHCFKVPYPGVCDGCTCIIVHVHVHVQSSK